MDSRDSQPLGLVFFGQPASPGFRRRRLAFAGLLIAAALALVWPVYSFFAGTFPLILGLPLSLAWVLLWLLLVFLGLVGLYWGDRREGR